MIEKAPDADVNTDLGYGKLFATLLRRRFWVFSVFTGLMLVTTPLALREEPTYKSSMQLLVEANYQSNESQNPGASNGFIDSSVDIDYATQLTLMRSSELLQRAIDVLYPDYPDLDIEALRLALGVEQVEQSEVLTKLFHVTVVGDDPTKTQDVLKALKDVYLEYNLEQQKARLASGLTFINSQLPLARQELDQSLHKLKEFRQTYDLVDPNQQAEAVSRALHDLRKNRHALQAELEGLDEKIRAVSATLNNRLDVSLASARLSQSTRYQTLLNDLQATERELAIEGLRYTAQAPTMINLEQKRQRFLELLMAETSRVLQADVTAILSHNGTSSQPGQPSLHVGQYGDIDLGLTNEWLALKTQEVFLSAQEDSLGKTEGLLLRQLDQLSQLINEYDRLQPDVDIKRATLEQLLAAHQELAVALAQGGFNWQVVESPELGLQTGPNLKRSILLNIIAGLFLGCAAAFGRDAIDSALHTDEEIAAHLDISLLGTLPHIKSKGQPSLFDAPVLADAMDMTYKKLVLATDHAPWRSLLVTSAMVGEGKTTVAIAMALSAARFGEKVLLIDANFRNPQLHRALNLPNDVGLSTFIQKELSEIADLPTQQKKWPFSVLTTGPIDNDPLKYLSSPTMAQLLGRCAVIYDRIIIDSDPLLGKVDTLQLASLCDGVCLVGRIHRMTETASDEVKTLLQHFNVTGLVANGDR
ncbi:MAG: polysaccharide biosynthesis tyrosine autokinase [Cyanobacteria bacterium P01_F01_bin.150]